MRDDEEAVGSTDQTGSAAPSARLVRTRLGPYVITVRVGTTSNEFLGVVAVEVARDFRSRRDVMQRRGFHDVTDLYEEKA